jgi:stringent starvation protein B
MMFPAEEGGDVPPPSGPEDDTPPPTSESDVGSSEKPKRSASHLRIVK